LDIQLSVTFPPVHVPCSFFAKQLNIPIVSTFFSAFLKNGRASNYYFAEWYFWKKKSYLGLHDPI